eukprot:3416652-Heterocapsa_arctica.AAC.1
MPGCAQDNIQAARHYLQPWEGSTLHRGTSQPRTSPESLNTYAHSTGIYNKKKKDNSFWPLQNTYTKKSHSISTSFILASSPRGLIQSGGSTQHMQAPILTHSFCRKWKRHLATIRLAVNQLQAPGSELGDALLADVDN